MRNIAGITETEHDVLVIGGGIYGVFAAWDAAMRGLKVALIEKGDFGGATSFNSLRVIHGGLRYLQTGDVRRMRHSIRERSTFLRIAPHLVRPMPFFVPSYGYGTKGIVALTAATKIHDWVGFDRNKRANDDIRLPNSYKLSRNDAIEKFPALANNDLTGAVVYYDSQMSSSERLIIGIMRSAIAEGAQLVNYVEADGFIIEQGQIKGVVAKDKLSGDKIQIKSRVVVNCAGPWIETVLEGMGGDLTSRKIEFSKAFNLLIDRQLSDEYAFGFNSKDGPRGKRMFFSTPWHGKTLIGTEHLPFNGTPEDSMATEDEITEFLNDINEAYPPAELERSDVLMVYSGLLPMDGVRNRSVQITKHFKLIDHTKDSGVDGLISVIGVKFTESRLVAQKAIDLAVKKLSRWAASCKTAVTPVYRDDQETKSLDDQVIEAIRNEMAVHLSDVLLRRTLLARFGMPDEATIKNVASIMSAEIGWDANKIKSELESLGIKSSSKVEA